MNDPTPPLTDCAAFDAAVQAVLDGTVPPSALDDPHARGCRPCREVAAAARLLLTGLESLTLPPPPAGFADRVVPAVTADRRRAASAWRTARVAAASLAASALIAFAAFPSRPGAQQAVVPRSDAPAAVVQAPSVAKSLADARSAVVSLTKRAATESFSPAKSLFASLDLTPPPAPVSAPAADVPAASAVQPIANTAKRAINLFIRDVSTLAPVPQQKS